MSSAAPSPHLEPDWLAAELADDVEPIAGRTQEEKVLNALRAGAETSADVAAMTLLPVKHCAGYLYKLRHQGVVRLVARHARRYGENRARSHTYELVEAG